MRIVHVSESVLEEGSKGTTRSYSGYTIADSYYGSQWPTQPHRPSSGVTVETRRSLVHWPSELKFGWTSHIYRRKLALTEELLVSERSRDVKTAQDKHSLLIFSWSRDSRTLMSYREWLVSIPGWMCMDQSPWLPSVDFPFIYKRNQKVHLLWNKPDIYLMVQLLI